MLDLNDLTRTERQMLAKDALKRAEAYRRNRDDRNDRLSERAMAGVSAERWNDISRALDPALDHLDHVLARTEGGR